MSDKKQGLNEQLQAEGFRTKDNVRLQMGWIEGLIDPEASPEENAQAIGEFVQSVIAYTNTGETPKRSDRMFYPFKMVQPYLDADHERYIEKCRARRAAGKQGGRGNKSGADDKAIAFSESNSFPEKHLLANEAYMDMDKDMDMDMDIKDNYTSNDVEDVYITYAENVQLTEAQYNKLVDKYGRDKADRMIVEFAAWKNGDTAKAKTRRGKKYVDKDYSYISRTTWVEEKADRWLAYHASQPQADGSLTSRLAAMLQAEQGVTV